MRWGDAMQLANRADDMAQRCGLGDEWRDVLWLLVYASASDLGSEFAERLAGLITADAAPGTQSRRAAEILYEVADAIAKEEAVAES